MLECIEAEGAVGALNGSQFVGNGGTETTIPSESFIFMVGVEWDTQGSWLSIGMATGGSTR